MRSPDGLHWRDFLALLLADLVATKRSAFQRKRGSLKNADECSLLFKSGPIERSLTRPETAPGFDWQFEREPASTEPQPERQPPSPAPLPIADRTVQWLLRLPTRKSCWRQSWPRAQRCSDGRSRAVPSRKPGRKSGKSAQSAARQSARYAAGCSG